MSETDTNKDRFTPDEVIAKQRNKQLFVLSAIIVVLAVFVLLTRQFKEEEAPIKDVLLAGGMEDETSFVKDDVKQVEIWKGPDGKKLLLNRDGNEWRVPSRFNAPADTSDVDALLLQVLESRRLNRASTETESQFANYRLDDKNAVHLRITSRDGKELLHVMVGRSETGARDFVRLTGEGAPPGIFELTGGGGDFNTLYSALNLDSNGEPQARRWISTKGFQPLPFDAVVQEITIKDGETELAFARKQGVDETQDEWELIKPQRVTANGQEVRSVIDALMNYNAGDIAGLAENQQEFGIVASGREIVLRYRSEGPNLRTVRLYFGKQNDDNEVAVWQKENDKGDYIYWAGDFILSRLFRAKADFLQKERVQPVPVGAEVQHASVLDEGTTLELQREKTGSTISWKLLQPWQNEAAQNEVSGLLTALNNLQGYRTQGESDREALGVSPGLARKVITLQYSGTTPGNDRDGQDAEDPPETQPEDPQPEPEKPALKTTILYFGTTVQGEVPMLHVRDEVEELWWVAESALERLFRQPINFVKPQPVNMIPEGWDLQEVRRVGDGKVTQMVHESVAENGSKRWMLKEPTEEMANQGEALVLANAIKNLVAVEQGALDKEEFGLGEGLSTRTIDLRITKGEESQVVSLYFGKQKWERATLMVSAGGEEKFYLLPQSEADALFNRVLHEYDVKVRHILISWKGKNPRVTPKDRERTKEEATELANQLLERTRAGEDFTELQMKHNEDSADPTAVYDVNPRSQWAPEFTELSARLEIGEAGIAETAFGYHIIKRIE